LLLSAPPFSLLMFVRDLLRVVRCFFGSGLLIFVLSVRIVERVVRAFAMLRRFRTRCPFSLAIDSRRFVEQMDAASPLIESLLERGWFLLQKSVKASWLLFDKRRANGMVSVFCRKMGLCDQDYRPRYCAIKC
jgi:hypothetical protein